MVEVAGWIAMTAADTEAEVVPDIEDVMALSPLQEGQIGRAHV